MLRNQKGMTLVEVLAVIVLIALIMGVVLKGVIGKSDIIGSNGVVHILDALFIID